MAEELINEIFDIPALKKQQDEFLKIIKESADAVASFTAESAKQKGDAGAAKTLNETKKAAEAAATTYENLKKKASELSAEEQALQRTRKQLIRAQAQQTESGQALMTNLAKERAALKELAQDQNMAARAARSNTDYTKAFSKQLDLATMNVSEMQQELSRLNRMSFSGLSPEQIAKVKSQMAVLKEEIGDFNKRIAASGDKTTVMIGALRGLTSIAQVGTGIMSAFGIENERLEKTMVQLIGVSQALTTIHELREKGTLRDTAAIIKNTAAKYMNITATKAEAISQNAATASTKAGAVAFNILGKAMKALPIVFIIAGILAIADAVFNLTGLFSKQASVQNDLFDSQKEVFDQAFEAAGKMRTLGDAVKNTTVGTVKNKNAINEYNAAAKEQHLMIIGINASLEHQNAVMAFNEQLILNRSKLTAVQNELDKKNAEAIQTEIALMDARVEGDRSAVGVLSYKKAEQDKNIASLVQYQQMMTKINSTLEKKVKLHENLAGVLGRGTTSAAKEASKQKDAIDKIQEAWSSANESADQYYYDLVKNSLSGMARLDLQYGEDLAKYKDYLDNKYWNQEQYDEAVRILNAKYIEDRKKELGEVEKLESLSYEEQIKYIDRKSGSYADDIIAWDETNKTKLSLLKDALSQQLITTDEYEKAVTKINEDAWQKRINTFEKYSEKVMGLYGAINAYQSQLSENEQAELQARLDAGLISQEQYDARVAQIQAEAARRNQAFAAIQVVIDTAKAIMNIWATSGINPIVAGIETALVSATGAFQLATINAQTIPGYYTGRDGGDAEYAYVGERGTEAVISDGSVWFTPPTKTLTYLPENASVLTAAETVRAMQAGMFTNSTVESAPDKIDELIRVVKNKKEFNFEVTEKGLGMTAKKAANYMFYINRNCRA